MIIALEAAPTPSVKVFEVAGVNDVGVKVKVKSPTAPESTRLVKGATPLTAEMVFVPLKVPLPEAMEATTLTVEVVTVLPEESVILTTG